MDKSYEILKLAWSKEQQTYKTVDLEKAVYRIFSSKDGHILWAYLKCSILDTVAGTDASLATLSAINAKRHLILMLKNIANRGKEL